MSFAETERMEVVPETGIYNIISLDMKYKRVE